MPGETGKTKGNVKRYLSGVREEKSLRRLTFSFNTSLEHLSLFYDRFRFSEKVFVSFQTFSLDLIYNTSITNIIDIFSETIKRYWATIMTCLGREVYDQYTSLVWAIS